MRRIGQVTAFYTHRDFLSNHYICYFTVRGKTQTQTFNCTEQYLMYLKAMLFNDLEIAQAIMHERAPQKQKLLGRAVRGFDRAVWYDKIDNSGWYLVGLLEKYRQNPVLLKQLLATGDTILAEASASDRIWGTGLAEDDDRIANPDLWLGANRCGEQQMRARAILRNEVRNSF